MSSNADALSDAEIVSLVESKIAMLETFIVGLEDIIRQEKEEEEARQENKYELQHLQYQKVIQDMKTKQKALSTELENTLRKRRGM